MTSTTFFFVLIPLIAVIFLAINLIFAPHTPYEEKNSTFECGFHSFLGQNRTQFSISFFIFALLFLLFDLEILLIYPYVVSSYANGIYGLAIMLIFFLALTLGFAFELGKNALKIDSRQMVTIFEKKNYITSSPASIISPKFNLNSINNISSDIYYTFKLNIDNIKFKIEYRISNIKSNNIRKAIAILYYTTLYYPTFVLFFIVLPILFLLNICISGLMDNYFVFMNPGSENPGSGNMGGGGPSGGGPQGQGNPNQLFAVTDFGRGNSGDNNSESALGEGSGSQNNPLPTAKDLDDALDARAQITKVYNQTKVDGGDTEELSQQYDEACQKVIDIKRGNPALRGGSPVPLSPVSSDSPWSSEDEKFLLDYDVEDEGKDRRSLSPVDEGEAEAKAGPSSYRDRGDDRGSRAERSTRYKGDYAPHKSNKGKSGWEGDNSQDKGKGRSL